MGALVIIVLIVLVIRLGSARSGEEGLGTGKLGSGRSLLGFSDSPKKSGALQGDRPSSPWSKNDDILDELVAEGLRDELPKNPTRENKSESFEDIRKSLGLE